MSFVLTLRMRTAEWQEYKLNKHFRCGEKMYNKTCYHFAHQLACLKKNNDYKHYLDLLLNEQDENVQKQYKKELNKIRKNYGLSKTDIEKYLNVQRKESYMRTLHSAVAQKLADRLWIAVEKVLFSEGKKLHYKKFGDLNCLEAKAANTGIIFRDNLNIVEYAGMKIPVVVRKNDLYAIEAIANNKIAYCKIIRKAFKGGYRFFLQIVFDGIPPQKHKVANGDIGIDIGTSTIAVVGDNNALFKPLTPEISKYNKEIIRLQRKLERSRKQNNQNNYNEDGTIKKGKHDWIKTNNYMRILFQLKNAYRRRNVYVEQIHNQYANEILALGSNISVEDMNFKALQKRSKKDGVQNKISTITTKDGNTKQIHKKKKKKRFGKSLNNHSPAKLLTIINRKLSYCNKTLIKVDRFKYRASQYRHDTDTYEKVPLSQRTKEIDNQIVQRDLYSAFLIKNMETLEQIDKQKCINEFDNFIKIQNKVIQELKIQPELPSCMGL